MWKQFQKTFIPVQIIILGVCAFLFFYLKIAPFAVIVFFFVMQIGNFLGVLWSARLRRKIQNAGEELPLKVKS